IPDINKLRDEINIWQQERNAIRATVQWKFSKDNARAKLKRHYNTVKN
ncbi:MAG: IS630 family transposase, partial [Methanothrix sp.]|nr:IS630 family transposase [Methanothrix sp.]